MRKIGPQHYFVLQRVTKDLAKIKELTICTWRKQEPPPGWSFFCSWCGERHCPALFIQSADIPLMRNGELRTENQGDQTAFKKAAGIDEPLHPTVSLLPCKPVTGGRMHSTYPVRVALLLL